MALTTQIKFALDRLLAQANLKLDSLTHQRIEDQRVSDLLSRGLLDAALYEDVPAVDEAFLVELAILYERYTVQIEHLVSGKNDVGYDHSNNFFTTPDLQAFYLMVQYCRPAKILEVGSGNSTRIARQAILDANLESRICSIDPQPRVDVAAHSDELIALRLEEVVDEQYFSRLDKGDILFIDSSHLVHVGNDVVRVICRILPTLKQGVIVHFHDIFLPYEYPPAFAHEFPDWGEQYLLHAYLRYVRPQVLWPGYQLQKERSDLVQALPFLAQGQAQSFWFCVGERASSE
ncbi:MAG: hypothetical protein ACI8Z1_002927 [Candidatus Azotimanducaceae bacterium]|jgi:hypothetical protein